MQLRDNLLDFNDAVVEGLNVAATIFEADGKGYMKTARTLSRPLPGSRRSAGRCRA